MKRIDDETLATFLSGLAAGTPEPGGGAAAALIAATGAALVSMVCRLSVGRAAPAEASSRLGRAGRLAEDLRREAIVLVAADADAYGRVIAAQKLPRATPEERGIRSSRIQEALKGAIQTPLDTAALADRIVRLADEIAGLTLRSASGDLAAGVLAARAALEISMINARINLAFVTDEQYVRSVTMTMEQHRRSIPLADDLVRRLQAGT